MRKKEVIKGLAGAAAIAGATQAYGSVVVVTNPANVTGHAPATTDAGTRVNIDFNGDGQRDLSILYRNLLESGGGYLLLSYIYAGPGSAAPGSVVGTTLGTGTNAQGYAYNLSAGTTIGSTSNFYQKAGSFGHIVTNYAGTDYGFGTTGATEYVGFRFKTTAGATDYGYIELQTNPYVSATNPGGLTFLKLAYENTGAALTAGSGTAAVPEPGSLTALALGAVTAAGVALKRRQRAAKA